jgi:serine phosphatase RsbU (regulator of sigma subunit)
MDDTTVAIGVATRPHPSERLNGDAWAVHHEGSVWRIAVIDGLGHGPEAALAAQTAVRVLDDRPTAEPVAAIYACHAALGGTRGAAVSVAYIDLATARLTYAGIGNVEARLCQGGGQQRPISYRGIVGTVMRTVRSFEIQLEKPWLLAMHSDGLSSRLEIPEPSEAWNDPQALADGFLAQWGRQTDDATVVVITPGHASERDRDRT